MSSDPADKRSPHPEFSKSSARPKTSNPAPDPVEIELKLLVPSDAAPMLARHPALQACSVGPPEVRLAQTTYFDSPQFSLAHNGLSLRIRRIGEKRVQTLKSAGQPGSVAMTRGEWEWPVARELPDLAVLGETPCAAGIPLDDLRPVFRTDIRRTARRLEFPDGSIAEAAMDEGQIVAGNDARYVSELELELKRGAPGPLYRLALALHADVPFTIGAESKAQRGFRLRTGEPPRAVIGKPPPVDCRMSSVEAMRRMVAAELGHLIANQPAAGAGDAEGVHQIRVSIRRLRTVLALYGKHLEPHAAGRFGDALRRMGRVFGGARDWDVFCTETLDAAGQEAGCRGWVDLLRPAAEAERQDAYRAVRAELAGPTLAGLLLGMAAWVEPDEAGPAVLGSAPLGDHALEQPVARLAPSLLDRMARRVAKRGGDPRHMSGEALHALRKAMKKLRYSGDFLAGAYPSKAVKRHQKAAKHVLALLGTVNDAATAAALADRLCVGPRSELAPAGGAVAAWANERRAEAMRKLPKAWDAYVDVKAFW